MTFGRPGALLERQLREVLDELEHRLAPTLPLWTREALALRLRGVLPILEALPEATGLKARFHAIEGHLCAMDRRQFEPIQAAIEAGTYGRAELLLELDRAPPHAWDPLVLRILGIERVPPRDGARAGEMVDYVATSVHSVFELCAELTSGDRLVDLGSGLGLVVLLAAWLTSAHALGIELEPAFVRLAADRARGMHLDRARFVQGDILTSGYEGANVIYLYYPLRGALQERLLERLESEVKARPIRLYSTGPSTGALAQVPWLTLEHRYPSGMVKFGPR